MGLGGSGAGSPSPIDVVYGTYTAPGIVFAKNTPANIQVAQNSQSGANDLTDVFEPVTLATGKITLASTSSPVIQGTATEFVLDFAQGDYLFYYNSAATPFLLGRIAAINSQTQITLTENSPVNINSTPGAGELYPAYCGKSKTIIGLNESVIIRIPVVAINSTQVWMPCWNSYRQDPPSATQFNDMSRINIQTYSQIDNPTQATNSPVDVPFTITAITKYTYMQYSNGYEYTFQNAASFPTFAYALLNPYGNSTVDNMPPNTLYKVFASQNFTNNGILVSAPYAKLYLDVAGYGPF